MRFHLEEAVGDKGDGRRLVRKRNGANRDMRWGKHHFAISRTDRQPFPINSKPERTARAEGRRLSIRIAFMHARIQAKNALLLK